MDNKMFRVLCQVFRILFHFGIFSGVYVSGQVDVLFKVHEDCRLHELCPLNCVRCDTTPQCYDMSDEFGCGHGINVFHKLFPGPPIPVGVTLEKLKENLWLEKLTYIAEQLQKSLQNNVTVKSGNLLFNGDPKPTPIPSPSTKPQSDSTKAVYVLAPSDKRTLFDTNSVTSAPRFTDYKANSVSSVNTGSFNSGAFPFKPSGKDFKPSVSNVPSFYSPKADASPLINWLEKSAKNPTSTEKKKYVDETKMLKGVAVVAVPLLPDPYPDPEPPAKKDTKKQPMAPSTTGLTTTESIVPTAPDIMPAIELPLSTTPTIETVTYEEPTSIPKIVIDIRRNATEDNKPTPENVIIFRPEPLPESSATILLPKVREKQDSLVTAVDSIINKLLKPQNNNTISGNIQTELAPTLSLSDVPMSTGAIPNLFTDNTIKSQTVMKSIANSEPLANIKDIYQKPVTTFEKMPLPSIPMLPGLIPQLQELTDAETNKNTPVLNYQVGDLFMAIPPARETTTQSSAKIQSGLLPQFQESTDVETNQNTPMMNYQVDDLFTAVPPVVKTTTQSTAKIQSSAINNPDEINMEPKTNESYTRHKETQGIPVRITHNMPPDFAQTSESSDALTSLKTTTTAQPTVNGVKSIQLDVQNNKITINPQNMEFKQSPVERQAKVYNPLEINQQVFDNSRTDTSKITFDQSGTIDILTLLFPDLKTSSNTVDKVPYQSTSDGTNKTPDVMPEIVPTTQNTPEGVSVTVSKTKEDNGNGCDRVQDYSGFCSTRTHGYFRNNFDCASYIVCDWGKMHVCRCPHFTMFDASLGVCNWETEVDCY